MYARLAHILGTAGSDLMSHHVPNMYASLTLLDEQVENMMRRKITTSSSQYVCQPEAAR